MVDEIPSLVIKKEEGEQSNYYYIQLYTYNLRHKNQVLIASFAFI